MNRERLQLAAATSRLVLGLFAITLLPLLYPGLAASRWLFGIYLGSATVMQVLIWRGVGGTARAVVGGLIDMAILTYIVHRAGSAGTMMVSLYFFAAIVNTLVVGRRVGVTLAVLAALSYSFVVMAEAFGLMPYGPDAPHWSHGGPGPAEGLVAITLQSLLLIASAWVVGMLVHRVRRHEAELVDANQRLSELSVRDPLTQLYNRRHLMERLEDELARVRRGHALAVIMIDLDRFKRINDELGHQRGDEVLSQIAAALAGATREVDVVGRYGGDEFVVLLPDASGEAAARVADRLVRAIREVGIRCDPDRPVTGSVGVAIAKPSDGARPVIHRADAHAYRAKQAGGDGASVEADPEEAIDRSGPRVKLPVEGAGS